ncbi:hypothetical protein FGB62_138g022 [Gracilaria domingensis]|nr:hypothetical protein FGB62_138g022 [Gracilaria domingensis]
MWVPWLLLVLAVACFSNTVISSECIFNTSASTLNAASEIAVSASIAGEDGAPSTVKFATASSRRLPNELFDDRPSAFFDELFNRRHNSQSYMWSSAQNEERSGAALAHLVTCATEKFARADSPNRHSLCISFVSGDQTQQSLEDRCDPNLGTLLLIGDDNNSNLPARTGTQACWCERNCTQLNAVFQDTSAAPPQMRNINNFVVLAETAESPIANASEFENGEVGNNRPGTDWFSENLLEAQSPIGKGIFPRRGEQLVQGEVLRSLRLVNAVDECGTVSRGLSDLERRMMARVEEEIGTTLNAAILSDLAETPARRSEIFLTITSALTAVLAFEWFGMARKLSTKIKAAGNWRRKLPFRVALMFLILGELAIENIPIYFLLQQEIAARNHVETFAVEVIGAGNELAILPIFNESAEEFLEMISALVVIVVRNEDASVGGIAVAAGLLSLLSISSVIIGML